MGCVDFDKLDNDIIKDALELYKNRSSYSIDNNLFKREFLALKLVINVDMGALASFLHVKRVRKKIGFSTLYNYMAGKNIPENHESITNFLSNILVADNLVCKNGLLKCRFWTLPSNVLRGYVRSIEQILGGKVIGDKWHPNQEYILDKFDEQSIENYRRKIIDSLSSETNDEDCDNCGHPDELSTLGKKKYREGHQKQVSVNRYERDPRAKQECINKYGCKCQICGFYGEKVYGNIGLNFIQVHHKIPLSNIGEGYTVPVDDLIPLCPNCHMIIHKLEKQTKITGDDAVEELKKIVKEHKKIW